MLKILYVSPYFPYYSKGGGGALSFNRIKSLSKFAKVDLLFLTNEKNFDRYEKELKNIVREFDYVINKNSDSIKNIFLYFPFKSLKESFVFSKKFVKILKEKISQNKYDIIWFNHERTFQYSNYIKPAKKIVELHDATSERHKKIFLKTRNPFLKIIHIYEFFKLKNIERKIIRFSNGVIVTTEEEKQKLHNKRKVYAFAFCPDIKHPDPDSRKEKIILYMGDLSYFPNVDALFYFVNNIFPHIKEKIRDIKFWIAGVSENEKIRRLHDGKNIFFKGFIPSLDELHSKVKVLVVPLRLGTGIRIKILEAMARRIPVVSTKIGCEGIKGLKNRVNIMLADEPLEFAKSTVELLRNDELAQKISEGGFDIIKKYYSEEKLQEIVKDILNSN